ncbi:unnamed protein product, partial [Pelagomonas calceolata]
YSSLRSAPIQQLRSAHRRAAGTPARERSAPASCWRRAAHEKRDRTRRRQPPPATPPTPPRQPRPHPATMAVTPTSPDVLRDRLKEQDGRPLTIEEKRHHVKSDVADRCSMEGGAWGVANLSNRNMTTNKDGKHFGFPRNVEAAVFSLCIVAACTVSMLHLHHVILKRDTKSARCATCHDWADSIFASTGVAAACYLVFTLTIAHLLVSPHKSRWGFPMKGSGFVHNSCNAYRSAPHEFFQFLVSLLGVVTFIWGLEMIAFVDAPGDDLHMHYIIGGHKHATRANPYSEDNPLGVPGDKKLRAFHTMELLTLWSVAFNGMLGTLVRLAMPTTMYVRPLWVGVDCVEVGTCAAISLARILEARGYAGWKIGGYSIYILGGLFRFVRLLRFERFCVMRYGENGAPGFLKQYINGPLVRFYMLILKVGSTICAAAAIVCMAEYPCVERSEKLEDDLQLADCNARFRHYQDCVYFLIVTFSTVGYGDMYPATRLGKGVVVFVLLFVLCFLPSLLSDIAELSDGDDTSAEEQQINAVAALHEAVLDLHEDVEHLAAGFEALGALAGRGEAKQVASHLGAVQERQDHDAKMRHEVLMAALRKVERRLADGGDGGRRRPDVVEED